MSVEEPFALPAKVWKAKLAALRSHYVPDDDPRVGRCLDALSYWRFRSQVELEVDQVGSQRVSPRGRLRGPKRSSPRGGRTRLR